MTTLDPDINILKKEIQNVAESSRNRVGTITAAILGIIINLAIGWYTENNKIPAWEKLLEREQMLATDIGTRLREIIDNDRQDRYVAMPSGAVMIGLTPALTQNYIRTVVLTESAGNQHIINRFGYCGIGQFGAAALVTVGLVNRRKYIAAVINGTLRGRDGYIDQKRWLKNPDNWNIPGGQQAFLDNLQLQIKAMIDLANQNIRRGYALGALHRGDSPARHCGFAKAAHLVGSGKASLWYKYRINSKDGNGTLASKYARDGERACKA